MEEETLTLSWNAPGPYTSITGDTVEARGWWAVHVLENGCRWNATVFHSYGNVWSWTVGLYDSKGYYKGFENSGRKGSLFAAQAEAGQKIRSLL